MVMNRACLKQKPGFRVRINVAKLKAEWEETIIVGKRIQASPYNNAAIKNLDWVVQSNVQDL